MGKKTTTKPVAREYRCLGCGISCEDVDRFKLADVRFPAYEAGCLAGSAECLPLCSRCVVSASLLEKAFVRELLKPRWIAQEIDASRTFKQLVALLGLRLRLAQAQTHDAAVAAAQTTAREEQERWWKSQLNDLRHRLEVLEAPATAPRALVAAAARAIVARACAWATRAVGGTP